MQPTTEPNIQQQPQNQQHSDGSDINPMVVLQPGEKVICEVKRHPFGMISQYITTGLLIIVAAVVALLVVPQVSANDNTGGLVVLIYAALVFVILFALMFLGVSSSIYWKNRWVVTTDSLTQILQPSLFGRQVSQLSLDDLEDVTVVQNGLLQTMLNFGTLRAETAGERSKFVFLYCPNPSQYARQILTAREEFRNFKRYNESAQYVPAYYGNNPRQTSDGRESNTIPS